jgi:predicted HicB family RNase H-like nuclease
MKNDLQELMKKAAEAKPEVSTPMQKVVPVTAKKRENEVQYMLWMDKELMRSLKLKAVDTGRSVKDLIEEAVRKSL